MSNPTPNIDFNHRFWVFDIPTYYPSGGMDDIIYTTDVLADAIAQQQDCCFILVKRTLFDANERKFINEEYEQKHRLE